MDHQPEEGSEDASQISPKRSEHAGKGDHTALNSSKSSSRNQVIRNTAGEMPRLGPSGI